MGEPYVFGLQRKYSESRGKISQKKINRSTYIYYEYARSYLKGKNITPPKGSALASRFPDSLNSCCRMISFSRVSYKSSCSRRETVIEAAACALEHMLLFARLFPIIASTSCLPRSSEKMQGCFWIWRSYTIVTENNSGQYYPDYAFNH